MRRVIWSVRAAEELAAIVDFIASDNPEAGRRVANEIFQRVMSLPSMPFRGRPQMIGEGRELVFSPWPYVAVYDVSDKTIEVLSIRHTARETAL